MTPLHICQWSHVARRTAAVCRGRGHISHIDGRRKRAVLSWGNVAMNGVLGEGVPRDRTGGQ